MTISRILAAALLSVLALSLPVQAASSAHIAFVITDKGDKIFIDKLGINATIFQCRFPVTGDYNLVYVLDYNIPTCKTWPKGLGEGLLRRARAGATVVLGYNTLRLIKMFEPKVFKKIGLAVTYDKESGIVRIDAHRSLEIYGAPSSLLYDTRLYHRFVAIAHSSWIILASFNDGKPAIVLVPYGRGRLILIFFNPVWPAVEQHHGYIRLVRSLHLYLTESRLGMYGLEAAATLGTVIATSIAASYYSISSKASERLARRLLKPGVALAILAHRIRREEAIKNPIREKILHLVEERGYVTLSDVTRALGIGKASAAWHLSVLTNLKVLVTRRVAGKQVYFKRGNEKKAMLLALLEAKQRYRIVQELYSSPASISRLARILSVSKSTVKHHIDVLASYGVVVETGYGYKLSEWAYSIISYMKEKHKTRTRTIPMPEDNSLEEG